MCRRFQGTKSKEGDQAANCFSSTGRKKRKMRQPQRQRRGITYEKISDNNRQGLIADR